MDQNHFQSYLPVKFKKKQDFTSNYKIIARINDKFFFFKILVQVLQSHESCVNFVNDNFQYSLTKYVLVTYTPF